MHGPVVSALHDPRQMGQVWPQPATWPGIPYVQGTSGLGRVNANEPFENYNIAKACFDSGDDGSAACQKGASVFKRRGVKECIAAGFAAAKIDDDYCFASKNDPRISGGRREDCLAALTACPKYFKAPSATSLAIPAKPDTSTLPAPTPKIPWGAILGTVVVAGAVFWYVRKK